MSYFKSWKCAWAGILVLVFLWSVPSVSAVETGPVERKWGLGWDSGLTVRLWLGGVWELAVAAGPDDYLWNSEDHYYDTGYPPSWEEREEYTDSADRIESGFVRFQAGRLVSRRGPLALVGYSGLQYGWTDDRYSYSWVSVDDPVMTAIRTTDFDISTWTLTLGLRPSWVILDFLTIETAFGLEYRWISRDWAELTEYPETGRVYIRTGFEDGNSFNDSGWHGMSSLQFIVWF